MVAYEYNSEFSVNMKKLIKLNQIELKLNQNEMKVN